MVTANVIERVFHVRTPDRTGTAFAIEYDGKGYIVTAAHVVRGVSESLLVRYLGEWRRLPIRVIGIGEEADVAVLARRDVSSTGAFSPVSVSTDGLAYGQIVCFLGFPYGWEGGTKALDGRPLPFVKAGIMSMLSDRSDGLMWVDAHGNEGFSGGPLVFQVRGGPAWSVGGVVSCLPVDPTDPEQSRHAGFVLAESIHNVTRLIKANPDGVPVNQP